MPSKKSTTRAGLGLGLGLVGSLARERRLMRGGITIIRRADSRLYNALLWLQALTAVGFAVQLLAARWLLETGMALASDSGGLSPVLAACAALLIATLISGFALAAQPAVARWLGERACVAAFERVFSASYAADLTEFDRPEFYDRLQRARVNTMAPYHMAAHLAAIGSALFTAFGVGIALAVVAPLVLPIALFGLVPLMIATTRSSRDLYDFAYGFAEHDRRMMYVDGLLTDKEPAAEVRAHGLYHFLHRRYRLGADERIQNVEKLARAEIRRSALASAAGTMIQFAAVTSVALMWRSGALTLASAAVAAVALIQLGSRFAGLSAPLGALHLNVLSVDDLLGFFGDERDEPPTPEEASQSAIQRTLPPLETLELDNVTFCYPGASSEAVRDVSLRITQGEVVALVGRNGSGKTTLAKIMTGLYRPSAGSVKWNGQPIDAEGAAELRDRFGITFQDFQKYQFSAWDNVIAGRPELVPTTERVEHATNRAQASAIIDQLDHRYNTVLSKQWENGTDLSIGQWQRIAIARAFYREADILVLDEPTSALDPKGEKEIFDSLHKLSESKTVVLISHRFSTVRSADRIIVLDEGRIVEEGKHQDLMRRGGLYAEMYGLQAAAYTDTEGDADGVEAPIHLGGAQGTLMAGTSRS